ncbi:hypothetical protein MMC30_000655 [Trapelia coarctata]|nr:hypothetical protein [Trapelia coarctata]
MAIVTVEENHNQIIRTFDLSKIRKVPILSSPFQESLRNHLSGTEVRAVLEDTIGAWGDTVDGFDANRFLKSGRKIPPGLLRPFGGGAKLCPGSHFVTAEILALVAMFALKYDRAPPSGKWIDPLQDDTNIAAVIGSPKYSLLVNIIPRVDYKGGK